MRISPPFMHHLLSSPVSFGLSQPIDMTAEGFLLSPAGPDCYINQGDDPPPGGAKPYRPQFQTLYGAESASRYEAIASAQLQARVQLRVLDLIALLRDGTSYADNLDEFDRGFDYDVEIKALHQLVEGKWGNETIQREIGDRSWVIRNMAVKAYVELHTHLASVTLDNQRAALAVLRGWLRHETANTALSGRVLRSYRSFVEFIVANNTQQPELTDNLLQKEIKALEKSMADDPEDSDAKDLEQQALESLQELVPS